MIRAGSPSGRTGLWFLAVDPAHQHKGSGRALLARVFEEDAEAPVYLDTSNPANVPCYASFGFEEIGRAVLPRGATMWFMRRPAGAAPPAAPRAS
jgi:ribosomal protein S18 acetylase RimI-like enzyme